MLKLISHMAINCKDQAVTEAWYAKHFGFRRARAVKLPDGKEIIFIKMLDSAFYLELFAADGESPLPPASKDGYPFPGFRHLAFKVADVDKMISEMGDEAVITLGPLDFDDFIPGWRTAWISDPDGRIVEISQGYTDEGYE